MKRFLLAALLGVTVLSSAGSVLAEVADPRPEGITEGVMVTTPTPPEPEHPWPYR